MCCRWKVFGLPALALLLAGAALVAQNVSAGPADSPAPVAPTAAAPAAEPADAAKAVADWQETGNVRRPPNKGSNVHPQVHPIRP